MVKQSVRKPSGAAAMGAGPGRPKGVPNKVPREVKAMILQALDKAGGVAYLARCATDPKTAPAFLALLGKVLPLQVTGPGGGPVQTVSLTNLSEEQLRILATLSLPDAAD